MDKLCPSCENSFSRISNHWRQSDCEYPELNQSRVETITGLLMSDAWLLRNGKHSALSIENTNPRFMEHLKNKFSIFSNNIAVSREAQKNNENLAEQFGGKPQDYDANTIYNLTFVSHPVFDEFESWYEGGEKSYPEGLTLTPTIAKYWYAGDGGLYVSDRKRPIAEIACTNEQHRGNYLVELFEEVGLDVTMAGHKIRFGVNETEEFLEWLGEPVPGFEYKWKPKA